MIKLASLTTAALILAACATTGEDNEQMAAAETDQETNEICRRVQVTGSRFHREVCRTQAEWARDARDARDATARMQNAGDPAGCTSPTC